MDFYLGQILMGGWTYNPNGTELCAGQIMSIQQNTALYSLLGTTFGGNGQSTFGLPDMRGRVPMGVGAGPGLQNYPFGGKGGSESVVLTTNQLPAHTHVANFDASKASLNVKVKVSDNTGNAAAANNNALGRIARDVQTSANIEVYDNAATFNSGLAIGGVEANLNVGAGAIQVGNTGAGQAHSNLQPYTCLTFVIVTQGIYPMRP